MNHFSFAFIADKSLSIQTKNDGLANNRAVCQFVFPWEGILRESANNSFIWQFSNENHIWSAHDVICDGFCDFLSWRKDESCLFSYDLLEATDFMHDEISFTFIQNVGFSKVCLSGGAFIYCWMSNWFFNRGSVPSFSEDSWCCWWCNCSCIVSKCGAVWASSLRNWRDNLSLLFNWGLESGRDLSIFSTRWLIVGDNSCSFFNCVRGKSFPFKLFQSSLQI